MTPFVYYIKKLAYYVLKLDLIFIHFDKKFCKNVFKSVKIILPLEFENRNKKKYHGIVKPPR